MAFRNPTEELKYLQRCMSDLVSVLALPAVWSRQEPHHIVVTLHDALLAILNLDFLYSRVRIEANGQPIEILSPGPHHAAAQDAGSIQRFVGEQFGEDARSWPAEVRVRLDGREMSLFSMRLGLDGEIGIIVAGSSRADFPTQFERLLLSVATNQVTVGLQQTRLLSEQKRIADELERRVSERTASLAAANQELTTEIAERKIVEGRLLDSQNLLRTSEARLRRVLDTIPSLSWCNLPDGSNEFLSKGWHDYTGLSPEEAHGWGWQAAFHPQDLPPLMKKWQELLVSGEPGEIEARLRHHAGAYRWFLIQVAPLHEFGSIVRWYGTSTDINDRKLAEEALLESERNLSQIINAMPVLAWSARADGSAEFLNQQWLDYAGFSAEKAKDWGWTTAIHPDDLDRLSKHWQSAIATSEPVELEARMRRFDGTYRWFLFRANPLRDESGKIVQWYGTNVDIEDRRHSEEALRESEQRFRMIVDGIAGLVAIMSSTGELEVVNRQVLTYFGKTADQLKGWSTSNAVHPDDMEAVVFAWRRSVETASVYDIDHRLLRSDGEYRWFHARGLPLCDAEGRAVRWYILLTDIHDRKQTEEALSRARAELAHVSRITSLGALTASIAHEVNQPLSGIVTNAGTCLRMLTGDQPNIEGARETARRTIRDGNRASEVVTRLRALFERREVTAEPIDLNEAAREVIALSLTELQSNRITLRYEFDENLPAVRGDRVQIQQVILNLIHNASDAMNTIQDRPRQIVLGTKREGDHARLYVQDSGIGFPPEAESRMFETFYTTKPNGMGVGLAVSRSIIEANRGRLWAASNDGPGATFAFSIPCANESRPHEAPKESSKARA